MSDTGKPDDRELEEFLAGRSEVSKRYREGASREGTPPELDEKVLRAAADAIPRERPRRRPWRGLRVPLALAATVVLSFTVFTMVREETGGEIVQTAAPPAPQAAPEADERGVAMHEEAKAAAAPAPAPAAAAAPQVRHQRQPARWLATEPVEKRAKSEAKRENSAGAGASAPAAATSAPLEKSMADAPARQGALAVDRVADSPEDWLARIRSVRDRPDPAQAREELLRFKRAYPDYPLPPDLQRLLTADAVRRPSP